VRVTLNFQRPVAAKLCVGREHVMETQEWYGPPVSPRQVWWGSDIARRQGAKKFHVFSSVTLLNDKVCERHFTISALEFGNDLDIVGYDNVCTCASAFNFVSTTLGGATAE